MHVYQKKKKKVPLLQEISLFFTSLYVFFQLCRKLGMNIVGHTMETKSTEEVLYSFIWNTCQLCCILKSK